MRSANNENRAKRLIHDCLAKRRKFLNRATKGNCSGRNKIWGGNPPEDPCTLVYSSTTSFVVLAPSFYSLNPKLHPSSISTPSVWVCHPLPLLLLSSWRSLTWSLKRDTLLEIMTRVVTYAICSRRYFTALFLAIDPPPPTTKASNK